VSDTPIIRLIDALRAEGYDDVAAGCAVLRVYPWASAMEVTGALMTERPSPLPAGWNRGMLSGKPAMDAIKAAVASIKRRDSVGSTRRDQGETEEKTGERADYWGSPG